MKSLIFILGLFSVSFRGEAQSTSQKMDDLVSAYAKRNAFNGTVLVAQKGNIIFQKAYGLRDGEARVAHAINDIFQIGSVTKQFTAAIIMQLEAEGKLSVRDKLIKYYPDFPNSERITIEHLLTHTSGIYNYTKDTALMKNDITKHFSEEQVIATFKNRPLDFEPGTKYSYSNSAYSLLGYIIRKVEKKPYELVVRERILQPLGMSDSGFDFTNLKSAQKSKGYFSLKEGNVSPSPIVDSTIAYSAGSLYSTVGDLYKWERAIYTDKILKQESWKKVFTPFKNKYGYGWGIDSAFGKMYTSHGGGIHGFTSYLMRFPAEELVIIMLDNASSGGLGAISKSLAAVAFNESYEIPKDRAEVKLDVKTLQQYVGDYQLAPNFIITIAVENDALVAQATGQPRFGLFAEKEDRFFLKVIDAQVEFIKDNTGKVTELVLYQNGRKPRGKKIK